MIATRLTVRGENVTLKVAFVSSESECEVFLEYIPLKNVFIDLKSSFDSNCKSRLCSHTSEYCIVLCKFEKLVGALHYLGHLPSPMTLRKLILALWMSLLQR